MSSVRWILDDLQEKREAAGLGVLSMGICGLSGELVSSTPIPGSRCGGEGCETSDYGGYMVGEGMTREVALYLGNLHNHLPVIAEAAAKAARIEDGDEDAAYLDAIRTIAERHGWSIFEGPLAQWIDQHLQPALEAQAAVCSDWSRWSIQASALPPSTKCECPGAD